MPVVTGSPINKHRKTWLAAGVPAFLLGSSTFALIRCNSRERLSAYPHTRIPAYPHTSQGRDLFARRGHAGRIGQAQVTLVRQALGRFDGDSVEEVAGVSSLTPAIMVKATDPSPS
jgi:hypothetical protein